MVLHIETPLLESGAMATRPGQSVWLKMEALQPSGSFKLRGIGHACEQYALRGARRFVSSSGGNAGIAAAHAGRRLGVPVMVVVPESASLRARELIAREGAEVVVHGASFQEANALAQSMLGEHDAFIHPFDDPLLWDGHATMMDEVARAGFKPDAVVLSVGGGGLLCGVVEGLHAPQRLGHGAGDRGRNRGRRFVCAFAAGRRTHRTAGALPASRPRWARARCRSRLSSWRAGIRSNRWW
jgi:L-serine/L-threonine ammonia-lyase